MNRIEFIAQLERLLFDIPESDRKDAIAYYNDYFDEAGPKREAEIIQELGSPGKVAEVIKSDMESAGNRGEFTEKGYEDPIYRTESQVPVERARYGESHNRGGAGKWALIIIAIVFAAPVILGVGGGLFGGLIGILAGLFGLVFGILAGGFGLLVGGITGIVTGIIECFSNPATGLVMLGSGMISAAISFLMIAFGIWFCARILPKIFRAIVNFISRIVHRGKKGEETE